MENLFVQVCLVLALDEKLDLHGCKCGVNKVTNINNIIYLWIYVHANVEHVYRHIYSYSKCAHNTFTSYLPFYLHQSVNLT